MQSSSGPCSLLKYPEEGVIAVCNLSGNVDLYDFHTGRYIGSVPQENHHNLALPVQLFDSEGIQLLTGGTRGRIALWDTRSRKRTTVLLHANIQGDSLGDIIQNVAVCIPTFPDLHTNYR